jgi:Protein of unknown function, DUF547
VEGIAMNRRDTLGALCGLAIVLATQSLSAETSEAAFDTLLARYVKPSRDGVNRVAYALWKASPQDLSNLNVYVSQLAMRAPSKMSRDAAFAFWCNLYNAITLKVVLERYPVASIRDIKSEGLFDPKAYFGPWRTKRVRIEGQPYSLDDIENDVMRPQFKDPRVHYAINCASYGCPNLQTKAWSAATLDAALDAAAREFVNHPRAAAVLPGNRLRVSSIYKWFAADFGGDAQVLTHLRKYAGPTLIAALSSHPTIAEDGYDWSLNDQAALSKAR